MDVHRAGATKVAVSPDFRQELLARPHLAPVLGEELEQLELLVRELELAVAQMCLVARDVDVEIAHLEALLGGEGGELPIELTEPGIQLGRDDRDEDEVVPRARI